MRKRQTEGLSSQARKERDEFTRRYERFLEESTDGETVIRRFSRISNRGKGKAGRQHRKRPNVEKRAANGSAENTALGTIVRVKELANEVGGLSALKGLIEAMTK